MVAVDLRQVSAHKHVASSRLALQLGIALSGALMKGKLRRTLVSNRSLKHEKLYMFS